MGDDRDNLGGDEAEDVGGDNAADLGGDDADDDNRNAGPVHTLDRGIERREGGIDGFQDPSRSMHGGRDGGMEGIVHGFQGPPDGDENGLEGRDENWIPHLRPAVEHADLRRKFP